MIYFYHSFYFNHKNCTKYSFSTMLVPGIFSQGSDPIAIKLIKTIIVKNIKSIINTK